MPTMVAQFGNGDVLQAERDGEFTAMMQIVGHEVSEDPLTRECIIFPLVGKRVRLREVSYSPAAKGVLDHLPGSLQACAGYLGHLFTKSEG